MDSFTHYRFIHDMNSKDTPAASHADLWDTFTTDPTTGITILSSAGVIVYINEQAVRVFFADDRDPSSLVGMSIYDIGFPHAWAQERVELFGEIVRTGERRLLRTVWNGKQQFSWMSPVRRDSEDSRDLVLVMTRRVPTTHEQDYLMDNEIEVVHSGVICLGELSVLTARELEILSLLGQGMSIKDIATALVRSVKTIENHRESIGRKLKKSRGVELAGIAQSAGLRVDDSGRIRMDKVSRGRGDQG